MKNENEQPVINEVSENQLVTRYRNGDEDAFREVVSLHSNSLYTFLQRFLGLQEVVEDIFQETFLHLYTSQDSFDANHPLRPWLYAIAANKAKDTLKKMQRQSVISVAGSSAYKPAPQSREPGRR